MKVLFRIGLLLVAAASGGAASAQSGDPAKAILEAAAERAAVAKSADLLRDPNAPVFGNAAGDVVIVKFVDYQCPYCKVVEPKLDKLLADDKGVKLIVKEFPILGPASLVAAKAALAAVRQGKYQAYHQAMMANRGQLNDDVIFGIAKNVGLDVERLRKDMIAPEIADQLLANFNLARSLKITLTPGYFINTHVLAGVSPDTSSGKIDFVAEVAAARAKPRGN